MLRIRKRTARFQRDGSFEHPKHILMDKKTITIFRSKFHLSGPKHDDARIQEFSSGEGGGGGVQGQLAETTSVVFCFVFLVLNSSTYLTVLQGGPMVYFIVYIL